MYRTETHMHTTESSYCAHMPAEDVVRMHSEAGYKTIIITDHYHETYFSWKSDCWQERLDYLMEGYNNAKQFEEKYNINILFAIELKLEEDKCDYLIYGITESFLRANLDLNFLTLDQLVTICNDNGFLIIQAHPFRTGQRPAPLKYSIPVEVFNGSPTNKGMNNNDKAKAYVEETGVIAVSGSDFHGPGDLATGGILTNTEIKTIEDFKRCILNREFTIIES